MSVTHVVGIDPGLVHTGVVLASFDIPQRVIEVNHEAVAGMDTTRIVQFLGATRPHIFIEAYRPRSNLNSDKRMVEGVAEIRKATRGKVLNNTGIKSVVRRPLLELLGLWSFSTPTHHGDLRSAARILVLGMLKDEEHNRLISDIVRSHLRGSDWRVV